MAMIAFCLSLFLFLCAILPAPLRYLSDSALDAGSVVPVIG